MKNCQACRPIVLMSIALLCCLPLPGSGAQASALEEVLVTANKTGSKDLQSVPMSVTALDAASLGYYDVRSVQDMVELVPNVTVSQNTQLGQLYIRGVGTNNVFTGGDPSATIHLDGVYLARPVNVFDELNEIERVEVLRGPQGTLYGRNSTGGTINVITRKPGFTNTVEVGVDLGNYRKRAAKLYANYVISDNALAANIALSATRQDGYIDNVSASGPDDLNNKHKNSGRIELLWQASDNLKINFSYDAASIDQSPPIYKPLLVNAKGDIPGLVTLLNPSSVDNFTKVSLSTRDIPGTTPVEPFYDNNANGGNITIDWTISENLSLKSISGYRDFMFRSFSDTDYTEVDVSTNRFVEDQEQASQELQLLLTTADLNVVFGAYYFVENDTSTGRLGNGIAPVNVIGDVETSNYALYTEADWQFMPAWHAIAGIRSSHEEKTATGSSDSFLPNGAYVRDDKDSWSNTSPKIGLQYQPDKSQMYYLTATKGFKSGGFNFTTGEASYAPETINAFEAGSKLSLLDDRLRVNLAAFYYDYSDLQVSKFTKNYVVDIDNAAEATVNGAEMELSLLATDSWHLHMAIAKLYARYDKYIIEENVGTAFAPVLVEIDGKDNYLNSAPQTTVQLRSDYIVNGDAANIGFHLNWHWQDKIYFTPQNDEVMSQGAYGLLNAAVSIEAKDERWNIELYGNNLFNKKYTNAAQDFSPLGATVAITEPTMFGVRAFYNYR